MNKTEKIYFGRINAVLDHINANLDKSLNLNTISQIACFSPYHFHRIFSALTGETINAYIIRKRVEKIASRIIDGDETSFSQLAIDYGFNNSSSLSRAFKKYYGLSPTEFKDLNPGKYSKICKTNSKIGKSLISFENYICSITNIKNWLKMNAKIEVKQMPEINLAYVSHVGNFNEIGKAYQRLMQWAGPKGILANTNAKTITVYHDDPKVTDISKVRQSAGVTVDEKITVDGEIGKMTVAAGKYAVGRFEINVMEFEQAWNSMCVWVAENGYDVREGHYYELYHNDHEQHPEKKFILDICVPVK